MSAGPARRKALVTLAIGERYVAEFENQVQRGWQSYAKRHGYDVFVLTEMIDKNCDLNRKSIHWQKLLVGLVPEIRDYDRVVWMDTDIIINPRTAPCIVSQMTGEKIGVADYRLEITPVEGVDERYYVLDQLFRRNAKKIDVPNFNMADLYRSLGYRKPADRYINTGVFVFEPRRHNDFLAECYAKYDDDSADGSFENIPFSYELQAGNMAEYIDERFNMAWSKYAATHYPFLYLLDFVKAHPDVAVKCVNVFYHNAFFCHFAGAGAHPVNKALMEEVRQGAEHVLAGIDPELWRALDLTIERP